MFLGQAVDAVVEYQQGDVHVVAHGMDPVSCSDREAVAVPGRDPDIQVRAARLDAAGHRQRTAVQAMETVGIHVVGQAA